MSPLVKRVAVVAAMLASLMLTLVVVSGGVYGVSYAVGWEGPQFGPLLIYRSTVSVVAGIVCSASLMVVYGGVYGVYRYARKVS